MKRSDKYQRRWLYKTGVSLVLLIDVRSYHSHQLLRDVIKRKWRQVLVKSTPEDSMELREGQKLTGKYGLFRNNKHWRAIQPENLFQYNTPLW